MTTKGQSFKEKGNEAFKLSDFPTAIGHYTSAILADPTEPTYPLNRAAAYLKLRKYEDAERDCTRVLELSNNQNPKALFRRAQARRWIGTFDDAIADLKAALKLEPTNQSVKQEIEIVQGLKEAQAQVLQSKGARKPIDVTKPTDPWPPHPKRRKVPIKIVDPESLPPEDTVVTTSPTPTPKIEELTPVSSRTLPKSEGSTTTTATDDSPSQGPSPASPSSAPRKMGGGIFRASGRNTLFDLSSPTSTPPAPPATSPPTSSTSTPASSSQLPREPPKTLYAFQRAWETCGSDENQKWELLKTVPPQALPQFLKTSLEPSLLASLLQALLHVSQEGEQVKAYMEGLGKVERIFTVLMFLSGEEKEVGREVLRNVGLDLGAGVWKALN